MFLLRNIYVFKINDNNFQLPRDENVLVNSGVTSHIVKNEDFFFVESFNPTVLNIYSVIKWRNI